MERVLKVSDFSKKDSFVSGGVFRLKNGSFVIDSSSVDFNASSPLLGWTPPSNPKLDATLNVIFQKGVAYFRYNGTDWSLVKYDRDYFVPIEIKIDEEYVVPENTQVLYHQQIDVNGLLTVDGMLIYVGDGDMNENCWWGNIFYDYSGTGDILLYTENQQIGDVITWQFLDSGNWVDVETEVTSYAWPEGPGLYRVRQERTGYCTKYSNIVKAYNL